MLIAAVHPFGLAPRLGLASSGSCRRWRCVAPVLSTMLSTADVEALVAERCRLRSLRHFDAADAIKQTLESAGMQLQDEAGGGTHWQPAPTPQEPGDLEIGRLAKTAVDCAAEGDTAAVRRLCADAEARCSAGVVLLGRSAADAAFDFALAGEANGLPERLAHLQADEFHRWRRPQPLATLQVCERLAAAGVPSEHPVYQRGADALRQAAAREPEAARREEARVAAAQVERIVFTQPRPALWLWRRAAKLRKASAPDALASRRALDGVAFADPSRPLVVDVGCGFGCSLLGLLHHAASVNVLGCDASSLKVGYARGVAARWGAAQSAAFVHCAAEETVAHVAAQSEASPVGGIMLQFPSPFRVGGGGGGGNAQLPSSAEDESYMVSARLLSDVATALRPAGGWLLLQSNVEDVAVHARRLAEAQGLRAVDDAAELDLIREAVGLGPCEGGATVKPGATPTTVGTRRRERLVQLGHAAPRAAGQGWLSTNPFGPIRSETEAKLELDGREVYRCLLRPS